MKRRRGGPAWPPEKSITEGLFYKLPAEFNGIISLPQSHLRRASSLIKGRPPSGFLVIPLPPPQAAVPLPLREGCPPGYLFAAGASPRPTVNWSLLRNGQDRSLHLSLRGRKPVAIRKKYGFFTAFRMTDNSLINNQLNLMELDFSPSVTPTACQLPHQREVTLRVAFYHSSVTPAARHLPLW